MVSRTWRKVKGDWDTWNARTLAGEPIVRLILVGTVARVRLDRRATSVSLLVALGVRADGQKVLLAIKTMGGESEAAWPTLIDDLVRRGLPTPELSALKTAVRLAHLSPKKEGPAREAMRQRSDYGLPEGPL